MGLHSPRPTEMVLFDFSERSVTEPVDCPRQERVLETLLKKVEPYQAFGGGMEIAISQHYVITIVLAHFTTVTYNHVRGHLCGSKSNAS